MGWCADGLLISANGFSRNFVSPSPSRLSAARRARWVIANSRAAPAIMPRPPALSRILKKPPHAPGRDRAREGRRSQRDRTLVRRRGAGRAEEKDPPPLGQALNPPERPKRSADSLGLHFRRDLSEGGQRRRARHAALRHRGDEPAPGRDRHANRARRTRRDPRRSGRMASLRRVEPPLSNITLIASPAKCPKLNPQENIWQFMRENWLSNRIVKSFDDIVDHCCDAWNKLIDQPWRIMSIGQ